MYLARDLCSLPDTVVLMLGHISRPSEGDWNDEGIRSFVVFGLVLVSFVIAQAIGTAAVRFEWNACKVRKIFLKVQWITLYFLSTLKCEI